MLKYFILLDAFIYSREAKNIPVRSREVVSILVCCGLKFLLNCRNLSFRGILQGSSDIVEISDA